MWCGGGRGRTDDGWNMEEREGAERAEADGQSVSPRPTTECVNKRGLEGRVIGWVKSSDRGCGIEILYSLQKEGN